MRIARTAVVFASIVGAFLMTSTPASAATASTVPAPRSGYASTVDETRLEQARKSSRPVIAIYKGKKINLARGWAGAQVCTETNSGAVHCFDSAAQADRALATIDPAAAALAKKHKANLRPEVRNSRAAAAASCAYGWVCLYEHSNYTGRKLQWSQSGTKNLGDWNFRDQASAGCVNKQIGGALVYDARTGLPDPLMALGNGYCYNFVTASYPTGGNWNDKADYMEM